MEHSDTNSNVLSWFQNQKQSHSNKFPSSCFPPSSYSAFSGPSSMNNTETNNTMKEEVVCERYLMREITKKRKLTPIQLRLLEESFKEEKRLEPDRKLLLAQKLGLQPSQVAVWFQNRRARYKTKQLEHDCNSLKTSFAKLKNEWDFLFLQNETLKNKVALLKKKLRMQDNDETQAIEGKKLEEEGRSAKSDNTQYSEDEAMGNQYSFPELAALGFHYDSTMTASNLL